MEQKRHRRIGGRDAAAILGFSKYAGPIDAYARIVEGRENSIDPFHAKRGQLLEPVIRELAVMKYGWELAPNPGVTLDPKREWCAASPDDLLWEGGVEYKSVDPRLYREYGEEDTDEVPPDHLIQCAHYMAVFDQPCWWVVAYFGGSDLRRYLIRRDLELEGLWEDTCARFWRDHILAMSPPPPDATEGYQAWLAQKYPSVLSPYLLPATPEATRWVEQLKAAKAAAKEAEAKEQEARNNLQALIGAADGIEGDGWKMTWKWTKGAPRTAWKTIVEEAGISPELVAKHTKQDGHRTFRAWFKKAKTDGSDNGN